MNKPNVDAINRHFQKLVSKVLNVETNRIQSGVTIVPTENKNSLIHVRLMIDGGEPTKEQGKKVMEALEHVGLPGIRLTNIKLALQA